MKVCTKCNIKKELTEYHKDKTHKDGHTTQCKKCRIKQKKEAYYEDWEKTREIQKRSQKKAYTSGKPKFRKQFMKRKFVEYFGGKCQLCGYDKCIGALEFHHVNPDEKEFSLAQNRINFSNWDKCVEEAKKCMLICNRCHRELHHLDTEMLVESWGNDKFYKYNIELEEKLKNK